MFLWFVVSSVVLVAVVFRSPAIDHRAVIIGALLPLVEAIVGGPRLLHSVIGAVGLLGAVVLVTRGHRIRRRQWLGVPIGLMCHLVLDGAFTRTDVFWWPATGFDFATGQIPEVDHLALSIVLEVVAVAMAVWAWRLFGLSDPDRRERFRTQGRLDLPT